MARSVARVARGGTRDAPTLVCSEIRVRNLARAERFYRALGLRPVARWTMENGERLLWLRDRRSRQLLELYQVPRRSRLFEPMRSTRRFDTRLVFSVLRAGPLLRRLERHGGRVRVDFTEGDVRLTFLADPEGTLIELVSRPDGVRSPRTVPLAALVAGPPFRRRRPRR
ncbi:MAG TPA: VOC family protein [Thermoplasmata archaeon]|nr:VOC family protein [Thermoplasmata archaeon]